MYKPLKQSRFAALKNILSLSSSLIQELDIADTAADALSTISSESHVQRKQSRSGGHS